MDARNLTWLKFIFSVQPDCLLGSRSRFRGWTSLRSGPGRVLSPGPVCQEDLAARQTLQTSSRWTFTAPESLFAHEKICSTNLHPEARSSTNQQQTDLHKSRILRVRKRKLWWRPQLHCPIYVFTFKLFTLNKDLHRRKDLPDNSNNILAEPGLRHRPSLIPGWVGFVPNIWSSLKFPALWGWFKSQDNQSLYLISSTITSLFVLYVIYCCHGSRVNMTSPLFSGQIWGHFHQFFLTFYFPSSLPSILPPPVGTHPW